ncbi:MAG: GWxTD domain-containing protein [Candidatus Latescibacteria bacterium]|nr:GWxTD domain-containing protein [Candidatus Latescibacterota bacterium]
MRWMVIPFLLIMAHPCWAGEVDLPPQGEGPIAFEVDVHSFRWRGGEGFEEVTLRFPVAQFAFEQKKDQIFLARYRPSLRVLDDSGKVVQQVEAESQMTAESLEATTDPNRMFLDMVQVRLPAGTYRGELTLSDLATGRSGVAVFEIVSPEYKSNTLGMSDLYTAVGFNPAKAHEHLEIFRKDGRIVVPNPSRRYDVYSPLFFYFEVYDLGFQAYDLHMAVLDRYGHVVRDDLRSFTGVRGDVHFAEGIPLDGLLPGIYRLQVTVKTTEETIQRVRKFQIQGDAPVPADAFDEERMATARMLLAQYGGEEKAAFYDRLDRVEKARFLYGYWLGENPIVASGYYGPRLGYGWLDVTPALLKGIGLEGNLRKRFDNGYVAQLVDPDTTQADQARAVMETILKKEPDDLLAKSGIGYAYFAGGSLPYGERLFNDVHRQGGVLPEVYLGMGLAHLGRKDWKEAQTAFEQALALRPNWKPAKMQVHVAQFLADGKIGSLDSLLVLSPRHREWWYAKGRFLEQRGDWDGAAAAYRRQALINPMHERARFDLARVRFRQGQFADAAVAWQYLFDTQPALHQASLDPLLSTYLKTGETGAAQKVISLYLRTVDDQTRALLEDIRLIASAEELAAYEGLPEEDRPAFVRGFWQKRDPTPVTPGNERLVEHYRRVLHAMTHFSSGQQPWDKRGEVYVRYGPPAHVSKSDDIRYETDADVAKVKDRLLMGIPFEGRKEIVARMGRLRTSTRDVHYQGEDAGDVVVSDFESIDYELNPNRTFFGGGESRNDGKYYNDIQDSHRDRGVGTDNIRGFPLFPIDGGTRWEYWIYTDIAGGIEIVFTALDAQGVYGFPDMPQGRVLAQYNQGLWISKRPDRVVSAAIGQQSEIYRPRTNDLNFHFGVADFSGDGTRSRLEIYYGVPLAALVDRARLEGQVSRGIALFDSLWTPVFRKTALLPFSVSDAESVLGGTLLIDELALNLPPGKYHLGVEVHDQERNTMGAYTREIEVEPYVGSGLMMSDVEMAGSVVEDPKVKTKGGRKVVPMPSKTYHPGQPVSIYYEVYGLAKDEFGQTHYEMDYQITAKKGKPIAVTILRAIGELLGIEEKKVVTISYQQHGTQETEHNYLEIDVTGSESGQYALEVMVRDLIGGASVNKDVVFGIGK